MKISEILSEVDRGPISSHPTAAMLMGYLNNELALVGAAPLTNESTGADAIAAIYRLPREKQDEVFQKTSRICVRKTVTNLQYSL